MDKSDWPIPRLIAFSPEKARSDRSSFTNTSEYMDEAEVLDKTNYFISIIN
jgi:hypothetical protein